MKFKTEKQIRKHLMGLLLAALMLVGCCQMPAYAASSTTGSINGITVKASVTTSSSSATAKTIFGAGSTITTTAYVYYWWGSGHYYSVAQTTATAGGGATATATRKLGGAEVVGGKGTHKVVHGNYTWSATTTKGTIYSDAIKK